LVKKQRVLEALKKGPRTARQIEHNFKLASASATVASLRRDGFRIDNVPYGTVNKYVYRGDARA